MIPNRGFQKLFSTGFFAKIGLITLQFKPEYIFAENLNYDGFGKDITNIIGLKDIIHGT